jgi:hypothetical protein
METQEIDRRVSAAELATLLNVGPAWLRELEKAGRIPAARRDPGSRRKWWPASEARQIVEGQQHKAA